MKFGKSYLCAMILFVSCVFSFKADAKVAAGAREGFKAAMETFGRFVDSGAPFTLAEFFSVESISMPNAIRKALANVIIVERSFDVSLEQQTAVLKFAVELFGQKVMAKLRMGLEYPGPRKKSVASGKATASGKSVNKLNNDLSIAVDTMLLAKATVVQPEQPDFNTRQSASKDSLEGKNSDDSIGQYFERVGKEENLLFEEVIPQKEKIELPKQEKPKKDFIIISQKPVTNYAPEDISRPDRDDDFGQREESRIIHGDDGDRDKDDQGDDSGDDNGRDDENLMQGKPVESQPQLQEKADDELRQSLDKVSLKEDLADSASIIREQVKVKTKATAKKLKDNAIAQIKSVTPKFSLLIGLPGSFKFGAIEPRLKFLDVVQFHKAALVVSQTSYKEPDFGIKVGRGLNLVGSVKMAGPLERVSDLIGEELTSVTIQGLIDPSIFGSRFSAMLPGKIHFGKFIKTGGLKLHLYLKEVGVTVGIETGLEIKPPKQEDWLEFIGEINVAYEKASLEFNMRGMWENVFGIPGPKIGNMKFKATTDYAVAGATEGILTLSGIGVGGEIGVGSKSVEVNVYGEISETEDILVEGIIKGGILLEDIVSFAFAMIKESTETPLAIRLKNLSGKDPQEKLANFRRTIEEKIPRLGFEKAHLSLSPKVMWFGGKKYDGVEFDLVTQLLSKTITMHLKVDKEGIEGLGSVTEIKIGPVRITGAGADKTQGTQDDGPVVSLTVKPAQGKASFFLNGKIEAHLFGKDIVAQVLADVSPIGIHARLVEDIGMFKTHLELNAKLKEPKDFFVKARMEQDALDKLSALLEKGAKEMVEKANRDISTAREKVKNAYQKVKEARQKIKELSEKRRVIEMENKERIAQAKAKIEPEVARYEQTKAELSDAVAVCKGKAPKEASGDVDKKAVVGQESVFDEQRALDELKNAGLNQNQIGAIRYEINRQKGR